MILLRREGLKAIQQAPLTVRFLGEVVGEYAADILVENKIILEVKTTEKIIDAYRAQA